MRLSWRALRVGNHGTAWKTHPGWMVSQPSRAFPRLEHEFQSELDEARVRAWVDAGYLAER
jgi:hypothetical protein